MMAAFRVSDKCNGCLGCVQNCPGRALDFRDDGEMRTLLHNPTRCARCATCYRVCPEHAVEFGALLEDRWEEFASLRILRCRECGEPVHTERLPDALDPKVREFVEPLCPRHKARATALTRRPEAAAASPLARGGAQ
ncbi:MAG: 4Fe-4S dicluster domain-containing protein [Deltaproteobacteria bacterium]|nr:4Fe-4S dicluster domain-containing protein [Deltaproteobacteria bacterium]